MEANDVSLSPPSDAKFNVFAVTSFVAAVVGFPLLCVAVILSPCVFPAGFLAFISLCSGLLAYVHIKSTGEQGKNLAIIGIIFGAIELTLTVCGVLFAVVGPYIPFQSIQY